MIANIKMIPNTYFAITFNDDNKLRIWTLKNYKDLTLSNRLIDIYNSTIY